MQPKTGAMIYHRTVIIVTALILGLPIAATVLYSFASHWGPTILPDGLTLKWFETLLAEPRFLMALGRSLLICFLTLIFSTLLVLPMVFAVFYYFPRLKDVMEVIIILPFAVPPVVSSVGLLQLFAGEPFPIVGTPWILIGTYFTITVPFGHLNAAIVSTYFFLTLALTWMAMYLSRPRTGKPEQDE